MGVQPTLYGRSLPDNGAATSWSAAFNPTAWAIPAGGVLWQQDTQSGIPLASAGLTAGRTNLIEFTRRGSQAGDTLTGAWNVAQIVLSFS